MKIIYCLGILLSLALLNGCSDLLEVIPENSVTFANGITTEEDMESLVNNVSRVTKSMRHYGALVQYDKGEYADETSADIYERRHLIPQSFVSADWASEYTVITLANVVLKFADKIGVSTERSDYYKGIAYFYKSFIYLELIRRYGDCILIEEELELAPVAKRPWTQIADYAIGVAEKAVEFLPEFDEIRNSKGTSPQLRSVPCKGAANAVLAHLCAWKAGGKYFAQSAEANYDEQKLWERAEKACSDIIKDKSYALASTPEEVCAKVMNGGTPESIFESVFKDFWHELSSNDQALTISFGKVYHSWPIIKNAAEGTIKNVRFRIYASTVNKMFPVRKTSDNKTVTDLRRMAYFYKLDSMAHDTLKAITGGFAYPYKWRKTVVGTEGWQAGTFLNFDANRIWFRLTEIYLLRAECRARQGNTDGAITDLNRIRERANAALYDVAEYNGDLRYAIFKEKEKEFLMEFSRYFDIIRNGYVHRELPGNFQTVPEQDMIDGALFMGITPTAFNNNPLLRQNTYWQSKK